MGGTAVRVALVLHLAREGVTGLEIDISEATLRHSLAVAGYLVQHFKFATRLAGLSPLATHAHRLLRWLDGRSAFSRREAYRHLRLNDKEVGPVLDLLEDHGYIRVAKSDRPSGRAGRNPSATSEVHPDLWDEGGSK